MKPPLYYLNQWFTQDELEKALGVKLVPTDKFEIRQTVEPIDVLGRLEIMEFYPAHQVYINGKRAPASVERMILAALDQATGEYLKALEAEMKLLGWEFK